MCIEDLLRKYEPDNPTVKFLDESAKLKKEELRLCGKLELSNIASIQDLLISGAKYLEKEEVFELMNKYNISEVKTVICNTPDGQKIEYCLNNNKEEFIIQNGEYYEIFSYKNMLTEMFSKVLSHPSHYRDIKDTQMEKVESVLNNVKALSNAKTILDIGCGLGYSSVPIAKRYLDKEIIGIDFSDEAREIEKEELKNLEVRIGDIEYLEHEFFDRKFSAALCVNALEATRPWSVFRGLSKIIEGPIVIVYDNLKENDIAKWAGWYGLKVVDSFTVKAPDSSKGINKVDLIMSLKRNN